MRSNLLASHGRSLNFLGKRDKRTVPCVRATTVHRLDGGDVDIRYHGTTLVRQHPDGTYTVFGGVGSATDKARINGCSPARVYQKDFHWYFGDGTPFRTRTRIDANGIPMVSA